MPIPGGALFRSCHRFRFGVTDNDLYVYIDSTGDYAGIDIYIAREACKRAGIKPQSIDISWSDRDRLPKNGDVDCLWCDNSPCYREDKYYWTEPYPTVTVSAATKFEASEDVESVLAIRNRFGRG